MIHWHHAWIFVARAYEGHPRSTSGGGVRNNDESTTLQPSYVNDLENDISYLKIGSIDDTNDDKNTICRPTYDKDIQNVNSDLEIGSIEARNNDK